MYFIIPAPELKVLLTMQIVEFWFVLYYTDKWLSCLDIHLHKQISQISSVPYVRKCRDRISRDRNCQTESAKTKQLRPKWLKPKWLRAKRPDLIGQSDRSCTPQTYWWIARYWTPFQLSPLFPRCNFRPWFLSCSHSRGDKDNKGNGDALTGLTHLYEQPKPAVEVNLVQPVATGGIRGQCSPK